MSPSEYLIMAQIWVNSFGGKLGPGHLGSTPTIRKAWEWEDVDDAGFVAFLTGLNNSSAAARDFAVDRSGSDVLLKWQVYAYAYPPGSYSATGVWESLAIAPGDRITYAPNLRPVLAPDSWWNSDEFGRPFDLNDLLA